MPAAEIRAKTPPDRKAQAKEFAALLKRAMEQPGVKEVMQVYGDWCETNEATATFQAYQNPSLPNLLSSSSEPA